MPTLMACPLTQGSFLKLAAQSVRLFPIPSRAQRAAWILSTLF